MSLADMHFSMSYNNQKSDVVHEFLLPALKESVEYDRAVGFFSSTSLLSITLGIKELVNNDGKIKIICSPKLSDEDIKSITEGYDRRKIIEEAINNSFEEPKNEFEEERFNILSYLIENNILDIKIAVMKSTNPNALFHVKVGIIKDKNSNFVAFTGSMNESANGFYGNEESIDVYSSVGSDYLRASEKLNYFNDLWYGIDEHVEIIDFPEAVKNKIFNYKKGTVDWDIDKKEDLKRKSILKKRSPEIPGWFQARGYQKEAYNNWKENNYIGIYDMATGTGKTYSALYSVVNLIKEKKNNLATIICCPYQHLVTQWSEDLDAFNFKYIMGFSSSPQKDWKKRLKESVFNYNHNVVNSFCFITTNASFATKYVQDLLNTINKELLIVIDEAHNFGTNRLVSLLDEKYTYRLALSATLDRHNDLVGTNKLYDFFETKCIEYPLSKAIEEGMLCNYYYYPIKVYLEEDELEEYNKLSSQLAKFITKNADGSIQYSKQAESLLIKRARVIAGARMKLSKLREVVRKYKDDNHLLVYCGSTTVVDDDYKEGTANDDEIRQIEAVSQVLYSEGIVSSRFTSEEDAETRERLKKEFDDGDAIKALVAIRCLDEGVNIPSIDKAIILASSTNPKEYVQRRGRVLRLNKNKDYSIIYDFVTLPRNLDEITPTSDFGYDLGLIKRELTRVIDFAKTSLNEYESDKLISEIQDKYGYIWEDTYDGEQ